MDLKLSFRIAGTPVTIAVCHATARALEQTLWLADAGARAGRLLPVLQLDPGLACFLADQLLPNPEVPSPTLAELAVLAADSISVVLADGLQAVESGSLEELAARAVEGVVRAALIRRLAEEHDCREPGSAPHATQSRDSRGARQPGGSHAAQGRPAAPRRRGGRGGIGSPRPLGSSPPAA